MATLIRSATDPGDHNGHCAGCAYNIESVGEMLSRHITDEAEDMGHMRGQLGLLVKLVLAAIGGIAGIATLWIGYLVSR